MVKGYVDENLQVIAEIGLLNRSKSMPIKAIVDTGFSGDICLSERYLHKLKLDYICDEPYELANGEIEYKKVYFGKVIFDNKEKYVFIIFTKSRYTLIGSEILKTKCLYINYVSRKVEIKQGVENEKYI